MIKKNSKNSKIKSLYNNAYSKTFKHIFNVERAVEIPPIVDGWVFMLQKNSWSTRIDAVCLFSDSGLKIIVSSYVSSKNGSVGYFWHKSYIDEDVQDNDKDCEIQFDFSIESLDSDTRKWFDIFSISKKGASLKVSSGNNMKFIEKIQGIGDLMEKMKIRILLEKLS